MRINLPPEYKYTNKSQKGYAYVEDGVLYMKDISFEVTMYDLAYAIRGKNECYYCGRKLTDHNRSLDHRYPRCWGGVSIPENLVPCCMKCNEEKREMTQEQFRQYRKLKKQAQKEKYYESCIAENVKVSKRAKFVIERGWITVYDIRKALKHIQTNDIEKRKREEEAAFFKVWGKYTQPVIFSANGRILQGNAILWHAKKRNRKTIIAIVLENVILLD